MNQHILLIKDMLSMYSVLNSVKWQLFVLQSSEAEGQLIESLQSKPTGGSVRELEVIHFLVRLITEDPFFILLR